MTRLVLLLTLLASPLAAWAACMDRVEQQAMSCAEGLTWDPETENCVPVVSG